MACDNATLIYEACSDWLRLDSIQVKTKTNVLIGLNLVTESVTNTNAKALQESAIWSSWEVKG